MRYRLSAQLCWHGPLSGKTLQVTVPGFTYGPEYWDFPFQPERYSYVRAATDSGYATLNVDRMLTPTPPAAEVTIPAQAEMLRQLVAALRDGRIAGTRFHRVIGVGHSLGAAMLIMAAANNRAFDGLILTDFLHQGSAAASQRLATYRGPAQLNRQFEQLPQGYLSTLPGMQNRMDSFYDPDHVDPSVVRADERTKRAGTTGELQSIATSRLPEYSLGITVPVLLVVGENDSLMCDDSAALPCGSERAVLERERAYYRPAAALRVLVLRDSGHDTNLHRGARRWFDAALTWVDRRFGN